MLKIFGSTLCRRCGEALEHTGDHREAPLAEAMGSPDSKLVCRNCGFSRPVIYAHVRSAAQVA